ncbi:MAG: RNA-binding S4 domain-containing protein [Rhizobiaceae bacterium]|nr:MAG: RNA-binding S4 domain-containing protein [Rhizobiaceae bacterium]CAG0980866.1 Heat shock protein 15 [Rhizobiaceae bacterium]
MEGPARQRLDKWLFFARVVKSRTLAAKLVEAGNVRVNRDKAGQAAHMVKPGDVLTIGLDRRILVYRVVDTGLRRGPAPEAATLYEDLSPAKPAVEATADAAIREPGSGRPTKKDRRDLDRVRSGD